MRTTSILLSCLIASHAGAQPVNLPAAPQDVQTFTNQGIQFSRINPANVQALGPLPSYGRAIGSGSWDFGLSRTELTQGQWVEFISAFNAVPVPEGQPWAERMNSMLRGDTWIGPGMTASGVGPLGRLNFGTTELGAVLPARGIAWYGAALYCNWLHNDRAVSIDAITNGVYDLRRWNEDPDINRAVSRQPGARYWIPRSTNGVSQVSTTRTATALGWKAGGPISIAALALRFQDRRARVRALRAGDRTPIRSLPGCTPSRRTRTRRARGDCSIPAAPTRSCLRTCMAWISRRASLSNTSDCLPGHDSARMRYPSSSISTNNRADSVLIRRTIRSCRFELRPQSSPLRGRR